MGAEFERVPDKISPPLAWICSRAAQSFLEMEIPLSLPEVGEIQTEATRDLGCAVCGELPLEDHRYPCPSCGTVHHQDCWAYNKGCARYACAAGPGWRARGEVDPQAAPGGKILLSHLSFGSYDGVYYAPWLASVLTITFELIGLLGSAIGFYWLFPAGMLSMIACILWIAITSERYYLDLDRRAITKAKAVLGVDLLEWTVLPLARVGRLALIPEGEETYVLAAVERTGDGTLKLAPPMAAGQSHFHVARDLLLKLKNNNVFPVEIPEPARAGIGEEMIRILEARTPASEDEELLRIE